MQVKSEKSCMSCDRIAIGGHFTGNNPLRVFAALPFVYLPVVFLPFFMLSAGLIYLHLRIMGARDLKGPGAFLPEWKSHRYSFKNQVVRKGGPKLAVWVRARTFWFLNCTLYCPISVGVLEWHAYLVKAVENWWCPFHHGRKENYAESSLDRSYWHAVGEQHLLHVQDRDNPIWNDPAAAEGSTGTSGSGAAAASNPENPTMAAR